MIEGHIWLVRRFLISGLLLFMYEWYFKVPGAVSLPVSQEVILSAVGSIELIYGAEALQR